MFGHVAVIINKESKLLYNKFVADDYQSSACPFKYRKRLPNWQADSVDNAENQQTRIIKHRSLHQTADSWVCRSADP